MTTKHDLQRQLDFAEARELALLRYIQTHAPDKFNDAMDVLNGYYTRIFAAGDNKQWVECFVPSTHAGEIEDALRLDGCDSFNIDVYQYNAWDNSTYVYMRWYATYEGVKRSYRELPTGNEITIHLARAGTID